MQPQFETAIGKHVLFYDGVCRVCDGLVQFILPRDHADNFRFIALQSQEAVAELKRFNRDATLLDTVYLITDYGTSKQTLYAHSEAILKILTSLGGVWTIAYLGWLMPRPIRDWLYRYQAERRYSWFGRHNSCKIPEPNQTYKFIAYV